MHSWFHVQALFGVAPNTLWRWCRRAHITPHRDPADNRRRYLDDAQLILLARLHQRVVVVNNVNEMMLDQIGELSRKVKELEAMLGNKKEPDNSHSNANEG